MTNYENIKNMSIEKMAEFIDIEELEDVCQRCAYNKYAVGCDRHENGCRGGIRKWLESEAEE